MIIEQHNKLGKELPTRTKKQKKGTTICTKE
jgi:hypothetical protein